MLTACGSVTVSPQWQVTERMAPGFSRVYFVKSGEVFYANEKGTRQLKVGTIYIFPSAAPFQIFHNPQNPLSCTYLHLDVFPILVRELIEIPMIPNGFWEYFFPIFETAISQESMQIASALGDVLEIYCREQGFLTNPVLEISLPLLYIAEHISQGPISVEELSKLAGYNPQYFIRLFFRNVGMTPHQYITHYRMSESVKLLRKSQLSIAQIAEQVGYPDGKSFGRAFKQKYGISATQFRKLDMPIP